MSNDPLLQATLVRNGSVPSDALTTMKILGGTVQSRSYLNRLFLSFSGFARPRQHGPVVYALKREAIRQAVRSAANVVGELHILMAICCVEEDLASAGLKLDRRYSSTGGLCQLLRAAGVDCDRLREVSETIDIEESPVGSSRSWKTERADPPIGRNTLEVIADAAERADASARGRVGITDLLAVLLEEQRPSVRLLEACGVDRQSILALVRESGVRRSG